jgi:hypothetical protein
MEKFLEELDSLLKQVCSLGPDHSGLRHKANKMAQQLHKHQADLKSGKVVINVTQEFWVFWQDGQYDKITGFNVSDAFTKAGYGGGAVGAVDFHMEIRYGADCLEGRLTFPSKDPARKMVAKHYVREIREAILNLRENRGAAVALVKIEELRELIEQLTPSYMNGKNDDVAAEFQKLHDELLAPPSQDGAIQRGE